MFRSRADAYDPVAYRRSRTGPLTRNVPLTGQTDHGDMLVGATLQGTKSFERTIYFVLVVRV